ncbi:MAG: metallophosphoesterase [Phormidesmis sp. RL_2_1]|nr:metallophosphoesterase [Phormidesmis sp. RL_2_1]
MVQRSVLPAQVRWQHSDVICSGIDQTQLVIADAPTGHVPFSFMVMGDTDAGEPTDFAQGFAQQLIQHMGESRFLLHTGDVAYPVGTYRNYLEGFLRPYQALLSGVSSDATPTSLRRSAAKIVFNRPLLPVPGNHDYAQVSTRAYWWHRAMVCLCDRLCQTLNIDLGCNGGYNGAAYGQVFLDNLAQIPADRLAAHLSAHYNALLSEPLPGVTEATEATGATGATYGLSYQAGVFTRLPNRYYHFRYSGVDFFALDSNTWNTSADEPGFDHQQLAWLEQGLITSCQMPNTIGRIIYLHHSPYTTEESRWQQLETLWVRRHLRKVLDRVAANVSLPKTSPLIDLVMSGHAHCFEHVRTVDTGHADSCLDWVVCGGSGASLRRQRKGDSTEILETIAAEKLSAEKLSVKSPQKMLAYLCSIGITLAW